MAHPSFVKVQSLFILRMIMDENDISSNHTQICVICHFFIVIHAKTNQKQADVSMGFPGMHILYLLLFALLGCIA